MLQLMDKRDSNDKRKKILRELRLNLERLVSTSKPFSFSDRALMKCIYENIILASIMLDCGLSTVQNSENKREALASYLDANGDIRALLHYFPRINAVNDEKYHYAVRYIMNWLCAASEEIALIVRSDENHTLDELDKAWAFDLGIMKGEYAFLMDMANILCKTKDFVPRIKGTEAFTDRLVVPVRNLHLFAYFIGQGRDNVEKYFAYDNELSGGDPRKHWYHAYAELLQVGDEYINESMNTVGKYLCDTVDDMRSRRLLYHSNYYESIALEYAYKNNRPDAVDKILYNGYDNYLETGTLAVIYRHDKSRFDSEVKRLKVLCLERLIEYTSNNPYSLGIRPKKLYGDKFCNELNALATYTLFEINATRSKDDPVFDRGVKIPEWAKWRD